MSFVSICKVLYSKGIMPTMLKSKDKDVVELIKIAKSYFADGRLNDFSQFLRYDRYLIELWVAHLIIEFAEPGSALKSISLERIVTYATLSENVELSSLESDWLSCKTFII